MKIQPEHVEGQAEAEGGMNVEDGMASEPDGQQNETSVPEELEGETSAPEEREHDTIAPEEQEHDTSAPEERGNETSKPDGRENEISTPDGREKAITTREGRENEISTPGGREEIDLTTPDVRDNGTSAPDGRENETSALEERENETAATERRENETSSPEERENETSALEERANDIFEPRDDQTYEPAAGRTSIKVMFSENEGTVDSLDETKISRTERATWAGSSSASNGRDKKESDLTQSENNVVISLSQVRTSGEKYVGGIADDDVSVGVYGSIDAEAGSVKNEDVYCCCCVDTRPSYKKSAIRALGIIQLVCAVIMLVLVVGIATSEKLYHYTGLIGPVLVFFLSGIFLLISAVVTELCVRHFSLFLVCFSISLSLGCLVVAVSDLHRVVSGDDLYFSNASVSHDAILLQHILFALVCAVNLFVECVLIPFASLGVQYDCLVEEDEEDDDDDDSEVEFQNDVRMAQLESIRSLRQEQWRNAHRELWQNQPREAKLV